MQISGATVVLTGGTSGIGRALAGELVHRGARVILASRSLEALQRTADELRVLGGTVEVLQVDVSDASSRAAFVSHLRSAYPSLSILINNAAVGLFEPVLTSAANNAQKLFETNVWGPVALMQELAPSLNGGLIVNISSAAAKYGPARQGMYAASKAALERLTESFALEQSDIRTLLVIPDRTDTPFMKRVLGDKEQVALALGLKSASAAQVAQCIVRAIERDASICYTTWKGRVYAILAALVPSLLHRLLKKALPA